MKNKAFLLSTQFAVMVLALSSVLVAEGPRSTTLKGTINDYNPFAMGGYEIRGTWSLEVYPNSDAVDFRAALNMEHSDLWMIANKTTDTTLRDQHTHHFTMSNARVISDPNYVAENCPTAHLRRCRHDNRFCRCRDGEHYREWGQRAVCTRRRKVPAHGLHHRFK